MFEFFEMIERDGPDLDEPKKPRASYKSLLGKSKKSSKLTGKDLHNFLVGSCVNSADSKCPEDSEVGVFTNLASIEKSGYNRLKIVIPQQSLHRLNMVNG